MMELKKICLGLLMLMITSHALAQFTCGTTGLLHMPSAEMQKDGTLVVGGNFLNTHNLPSNYWWGYDTFNYFVNFTFFDCLEIAYVMTGVKGQEEIEYWPQETWGRFVNQDRHFAARLHIVKEGAWRKFMPSIVIGVNDPTTGTGGDYSEMGVDGEGNGYFNRWYMAVTKHFYVPYGELGVHAAYLYNKRTDYPLNGPAFGVNFRPSFHRNLNVIAEYDAKTINVGATYAFWADHFNFLFELQEGKYISAGLVYKVNMKGGNEWKARIWDY